MSGGEWRGELCSSSVQEWTVTIPYGGHWHTQRFPGAPGGGADVVLRVLPPAEGVLRLLDAADARPLDIPLRYEAQSGKDERRGDRHSRQGMLHLGLSHGQLWHVRLESKHYEPVELEIDPAGPGPWPREVVLRRKT